MSYVSEKARELFSSTWAPGGEARAEAILIRVIEDCARAAEKSYRDSAKNRATVACKAYDPVCWQAIAARVRCAEDIRELAQQPPTPPTGSVTEEEK